MTFSSLISGTVPHHNKHRGRGPVNRLVLHHWAGVYGGDTRLQNPNADVSASYILYSDGRLIGQVPEEYRPWTTGPTGDAGSITVETQNTAVGGNWPVSAAAKEKLAQLLADLSKRYGWGTLVRGKNVRVHQEFAATACPGPDLIASLDSIIARANQILSSSGTPAPAPSGTYTVVKGDTLSGIGGKLGQNWKTIASLNGISAPYIIRPGQKLSIPGGATPAPAPTQDLTAVARAVIRGDYDNGAERVRLLTAAGYNASAVQARVNQLLSEGSSTPTQDLTAVARAVIRGDYDNGAERVRLLTAAGYNASAVQAEVNRLLR